VFAQQEVLIKQEETSGFSILKSDELVIGGYASIEVVDKQNDLITLEALKKAVSEFMSEKSYRNVMSNHSNVQVGEVIEKYRDNNGVLHKTGVDNVGFYVVIKMRDDIEKAKEIARGIRKGTLRSFSIGGQAISKKQKNSEEYGEYNEIDNLELHEVTICEKGINPEAKFDILKHENGGDNLSEKLEKALAELNTLLKEVREVTGDEVTKEMDEEKGMHEKGMHEDEKMMNEKGMHDDEKMEYKEEMDDKEDVDMEEKALDEDSTRDYEAGENVVVNGRPVAAPKELGPISKGLEAADFSTLDLSAENVEKAYAQFRAEQLEKLAYDNLSKQFEARFSEEMDMKKSLAEKAEYDAQTEVSALKEEFAELRKALSEKDDNIRKAAEVAMELPEGFPTTAEAVAEMSWGELHNLARRVN
jgi:HK97 family phage prohead protease